MRLQQTKKEREQSGFAIGLILCSVLIGIMTVKAPIWLASTYGFNRFLSLCITSLLLIFFVLTMVFVYFVLPLVEPVSLWLL